MPPRMITIRAIGWHRPLARSEIASTRTSRIIGSDSEETAPKPLICIGLGTDASERIGFVRVVGPTNVASLRRKPFTHRDLVTLSQRRCQLAFGGTVYPVVYLSFLTGEAGCDSTHECIK